MAVSNCVSPHQWVIVLSMRKICSKVKNVILLSNNPTDHYKRSWRHCAVTEKM